MEEMDMAGWQRYDASDSDGLGTGEIEAVIDTVDAANWEEDFDLGEPWDAESEVDPTDDDPE
jgi:hypothetical protein